MISNHREIRYTSGITIQDSRILSTLSLVYDSVILPPRPVFTDDSLPRTQNLVITEHEGAMMVNGVMDSSGPAITQLLTELHEWDVTHHELFSVGVLRRAPQPSPECDPAYELVARQEDVTFLRPLIMGTDCLFKSGSKDEFYIPSSMLQHGFRDDIDAPALFHVRRPTRDVPVLAAALAASAVSYVIPRVPDLACERILDLRSKVEATREGFLMHLQSMSRELADGLSADAPVAEVLQHANVVAQRTLVPDYVEFKRQLASLHGSIWSEVANAANDFFEIDAAPWTPKFWGAVLRTLGLDLLRGVRDHEDHLTNRAHAMTFLRTVEGADL
jgi:hypothetical protein